MEGIYKIWEECEGAADEAVAVETGGYWLLPCLRPRLRQPSLLLGGNSDGQLGNNSTTKSSVPVAVTTSGALSGKTIRQVAAGFSHACALASDNQAYCWGNNYDGELGNNATTNSSVPVPVTTSGILSGKAIRQAAAGYTHTCALASDNQAYCWGYNYFGQLGNNSTTNSSVPVAVNNLPDFPKLANTTYFF